MNRHKKPLIVTIIIFFNYYAGPADPFAPWSREQGFADLLEVMSLVRNRLNDMVVNMDAG